MLRQMTETTQQNPSPKAGGVDNLLRAALEADPQSGGQALASLDESTRADIIREAIAHMDTQLLLVRSRLGSLEQLEDELSAKRRKVRSMLAEIEQAHA